MFWFSLVVAAGVFIGFMSLVGSPSEVETVIGLVIAAIAFLFSLFIGWKLRSAATRDEQKARIAALEKENETLRARK